MISVLLTQFRNRYPTASLTAELLTLHNDHYVVRAQIQVDGTTMATGLAAAASIEAAEDQARIRALQALGLENGSRVNPTLPIDISEPMFDQGMPITEEPVATPQLTQPETVVSSPVNPADSFSFINPDEVVKPSSPVKLKSQTDKQKPPTDTLKPQTDKPKPQTDPLQSQTDYLKPQTEDWPASNAENPNPTPPTPLDISQGPIDLSDIIAQTDVELRRLGWTSIQGREYLEQTYQKRSRQQLSDEELLAFLLYLESQPSPSESQI